MQLLASKQLSKEHNNMKTSLFEHGGGFYVGFELNGKERSAYFRMGFIDEADARDYWKKLNIRKYDKVLAFLIEQARKV